MKCLLSILFALLSSTAQAFSWQDLWKTADQQGQLLMKKGEFKQAQQRFQQQDWRAAAAYRAGDYQEAAKIYQSLDSEPGYYNRGNALSHLGQYEKAIQAYDQALALNPENQDAIFNRELVKKLLQKNKEERQSQQANGNSSNNQKQQKEQQQNQQESAGKKEKQQDNNEQESKNKKESAQQATQKEKSNQQAEKKQGKQNEDKSQSELEKQQAKAQWLRLIPDDPGGLLREKFLRDYLRRQRGWDQ